jgi:hypothetical protein
MIMLRLGCVLAAMLLVVVHTHAAETDGLFDGKTFAGWNGDTEHTWRIERGTIVAGSPETPAPRNEFLATDVEYDDFVLRLEYRVECTKSCNAGIQFRSQRVPSHHEMVGYQADIAPGITGAIYDETRRNKLLVVPPKDTQQRALALAKNGWNEYVIRCEGPRIRLAINGVEMADYTEADQTIPQRGRIGLQIHGGFIGQIRYRAIRIEPLGDPP